ncbi:dihydroorotase family protein [Treponema sp. HNW]|uniref:dihydroorotase n=1 Tax=Treponema sp. HNW TaxID=3116654 RepID=UPI003D108866
MLVLKNARNVSGEKTDVFIDKGIIQDVRPSVGCKAAGNTSRFAAGGTSFFAGAREIDLEGKILMPGIIDLHTHMRDPGLTHKEDFYTGSRACAKGGISFFFDMPNTVPPTVTEAALKEKMQKARERSIVNCGFHFGASNEDNVEEIRNVIQSGAAVGTKVFLNESTGLMLIRDRELLKRVFKAGGLIFVHAENEMIDTAVELNARYGRGLYICHISSKREMEAVIKAKQNPELNNKNHPVYAEVTPHHLFLTENLRSESPRRDMLLRMKPELKSQSDADFLMQAIKDGFVDTIGTDHAPHTAEEKLSKLCFGIPGVETSLALMLTAVHRGLIDMNTVQKLMCENPAAIMNLSKKGKLLPGFDADIIAVDPHKEWTLTADDLESKCKWSPYEGRRFTGKNILTIVGGKIVYENGRFKIDG